MANKYRIMFKTRGSRGEFKNAPMAPTISEALTKYLEWGKRPTDEDQNIILSIARRDEGEWVFVSEEDFKKFDVECFCLEAIGALSEVCELRHTVFKPHRMLVAE